MIIRSKDQIPQALEMLKQHDIWSFDIESSGLNCRKDKVIGFGCANPITLKGFYIITREWISGELVEVLAKEDVLPVLQGLKSKKLLGWNFAFDASFILAQYNIDLMKALYCEVMLVVHSCDENRFNYGLKQISAEIFGGSATQEQDDLKESIKANGGTPKEFYKANSGIMAKYGLQDNILTCRNYNYWLPILRKENLEKFFFQDEVMPLYKEVTFWMQYKGVPVDVPLLQQAQLEIIAELEKLNESIQAQIKPHLTSFEDWFIRTKYPFKMGGSFKQCLAEYLEVRNWPTTKSGTFTFSKTDVEKAVKKGLITTDTLLYGIVMEGRKVPDEVVRNVQLRLLEQSGTKYPFNLSSKDHLKRLFFKKHGGPLDETALSFTDLGAPQVNDDFLSTMAVKYPWARELQDYNSLTKIKGTYIDRFLEEQENGVFYPSFFQHRTVSGRYSGDLQQLPRPLEAGTASSSVVKFTNLVRRFFIAAPQHTFADFDYDSQEVKVFAHVSGDEGLKNIFAKGHDFYSTVCIEAEQLEGYSADKASDRYLGKLNKAARQRAKSYALGCAFGMSPYKLQFELKCSESEAQRVYSGYMKAYPKLKEWMDWTKKTVCQTGTIKTEAGRVRRSPQLARAYAEHGEILFNGLELWKRYNEQPATYKRMKELAGQCKNALNNFYNHQIQGLAASITNRAAIKTAKKLKEAGLSAYICNVTHDQITVHCHEKDLEIVAPLLTEAMETAYPISVPLTAPPSWGINFAESKG